MTKTATVSRNEHLSVSRVNKYATCPRDYDLSYPVGTRPERSTSAPAELGSLCHDVMEDAAEVARLVGTNLDQVQLGHLYRRKFAARMTMKASSDYADGLLMVRHWAADLARPDHHIVGIERKFVVRRDGHSPILGFVDRIDQRPDGSVDVIDYKTARVLPDAWDIADHLQMTVYSAVARRWYPDAPRIRVGLAYLRHGVTHWGEYTPEREDAALEYMWAMGERMDTDSAMAPQANEWCGYCDHREACPLMAYAGADVTDFEGMLRARMAYDGQMQVARKNVRDMDKRIKAAIEAKGEGTSISAGGFTATVTAGTSPTYRVKKTVDAIASELDMDAALVASKVCKVDPSKLKAFCNAEGERGDLALAMAKAGASQRAFSRLVVKSTPWSERE